MQEIGRYLTDDLKHLYITTVLDDESIKVTKYIIDISEEKVFT